MTIPTSPATYSSAVGGVAQDLHDLAFVQSHEVTMRFLPSAWAVAPNVKQSWVRTEFPPAKRNTIPKEPGVYTFVVATDLFDFPAASGLFYVGKATNLYDRIGAYIGEISKQFSRSRRPHVWNMINRWNGHLRYYYTTTIDVAVAESLETDMMNALLPPFNRQYDATMGPTLRAFP